MSNDRRLLAFALGSFHATLLTMLLVLPFFLLGGLGNTLEGLSTAAGLAVFGALWGTSVYATYRGVGASQLEPGRPADTGMVIRAGETWGAWNGVLFFWCLLAGGIVAIAVTSSGAGAEQLFATVIFALAALVIGSVFALLFGGFLGYMTALLELGLLKIARLLAGVR